MRVSPRSGCHRIASDYRGFGHRMDTETEGSDLLLRGVARADTSTHVRAPVSSNASMRSGATPGRARAEEAGACNWRNRGRARTRARRARLLRRLHAARSWARGEDVGDGSAAESDSGRRLDGERRGEDPLARAQDDRMDDKAVLVDQ